MESFESNRLKEYFEMKNSLEMPLRIRLYFSMFEKSLQNQNGTAEQSQASSFSKQMLKAYNNKSQRQKCDFLYLLILTLKQADTLNKIASNLIEAIDTTCHISSNFLGLLYWNKANFKFEKAKGSITIIGKKKTMNIDLKNYFIRKSQKHANTLVLEAITEQMAEEDMSIHLQFNTLVFQSIYKEVQVMILRFFIEKLHKIMNESMALNVQNNKTLVFLNKGSINEYLIFKDSILKKLLTGKIDFQTVKQTSTYKIQRNSKNGNLFKLQSTMQQCSVTQVKEQFMKKINQFKFLLMYECLEDFSKKYYAIYEKYLMNHSVYELISIRQQANSQQQEVLFMKGLDNLVSHKFLNFLYVRIRALGPKTSKLIVVGSFQIQEKITLSVIQSYLAQFRQMLFRKQIYQEDDDFRTVIGGGNFFIEDQMQQQQIEPEPRKMIQRQLISFVNLQMMPYKPIPQSKAYLEKHFQTQPTSDTNYVLMKEQLLFKQWRRKKAGGLICIDQQSIAVQKNLAKQVIMNFGKNLLKGTDFLTTGLMPVSIMKKQSMLTAIARDFCYAPIFFDKLGKNGSNPLERMKYTVLQIIGLGTLGISMNKPFNPILGETLQVFIGGCPMSLEQISHHPAITSYHLQGRKYRIYGSICPKVYPRLNSFKAYSQEPNYIEFDDGTKILMMYGHMAVYGFIMGDRQFHYEDDCFAYDITNHIFAKIHYGPRQKGGMLGTNSEPLDFLHGKIYKVKPEFYVKFKSQGQKIYPGKQHIISQLSEFQGFWCESVKFDNKQYVDFSTDFPCEIIPEKFPLPSDSRYRTDLIKSLENKTDEAQDQKNRLEQIQRKDKKLRQQNAKKRK